MNNKWEIGLAARTTRITVEVGGYRWRVHGAISGTPSRWNVHLAELLGSERLDVSVNRDFLLKMREAVAKALDLQVEAVKRITADLILA